MRQPLPKPGLPQPYCVVVCYNSTHVPQFALTNYGIGANDTNTVTVKGYTVPVLLVLDNFMLSDGKPEGMGNGLIRREASLSIKFDGPFSSGPFSKKFYSAGASQDSFYFGIWVSDYSLSISDVYLTGLFFGYYKLDMGISWEEATLGTTLKLIEWTLVMNGRYNNNTEAAENILDGSEWQRLIQAPSYLGYRSKVQAVGRVDSGIGGYPSYNKAVLGVIAGVVQSSVLSGTSIILGKSPTLATIVGTNVKLKLGNGALVTGTITDLTGGIYGIDTTGMVLNVSWDSVAIKHIGTLGVGVPLTTTFKSGEIVLDTAPLTRIPSPTMFIQSPGNIEFYLAGVQTSASPIYVKLTGILDEVTKKLGLEDVKDVANPTWPYAGVNVNFDAVQQSSNFSGADAHLNYANWQAAQTYTLHFSNKTFALVDIQKEGMPWEIIVTPHVNNTVPVTNVFYIRMIENTTIQADTAGRLAIFYSNGTGLIQVPAADITSVAYANTDFSMVNMAKITLKKRPSDTNAAYDNNFLYVDTWPPLYAADVIKYILAQGGMPAPMLGASLSTDDMIGNTLSLEINAETWTELLDSVMFESGLLLYSDIGKYHVRKCFNNAVVRTWNRLASSETYMMVVAQADIAFNDVIENTYRFNIGRNLTSVDASGREYVRVHYTFKYKTSNFGGEKLRVLRSVKAAKNNDRIIDYTFKHITDSLTCRVAATQITRIGHPANIPETTRQVEIGLPLSYMHLQAMDVVALKDFRHITRIDADVLPVYDETSTSNPVYTTKDGSVFAKYSDDVPYLLIPGIGVITNIEYDLSGDGPPIKATFKQVQVGTASNIKEVTVKSNTAIENTAELATTPGTSTEQNTPNTYLCPMGASVVNVIITPGDAVINSPTVNDACCNTSTTDATTYNDPIITIICVDGNGNPSEEWPSYCNSSMYIYIIASDFLINDGGTLFFPVYATGKISTFPNITLESLSYPGEGVVSPSCAVYTPLYDDTGATRVIGVLAVQPCVFGWPNDMYEKSFVLRFGILGCSGFNPGAVDDDANPNTPPVPTWPPTYSQQALIVTVTLSKTSDIAL